MKQEARSAQVPGWTDTWQFTPVVVSVTREPKPRTLSQPEPTPTPPREPAPAATRAQPPTPTERRDSSRSAEREQRVRITGRLAYEPQIHEMPNGGRRVSFSLAEHTDDDQTLYHSVYSTKQFADRIAGRDLHKGDRIELVGARQMARKKDKDGHERLVPVIYAYGVKPR